MLRYFIADVHLSEAEPSITEGFVRFLQQLPDRCELYILGDLFDYWVGDDAQTELHRDIAHQFKSLSHRGIHLFFIRGNRDFLLDNDYAAQCAMTILPELYTLEHNQKRILIMHGDVLCTDDKSYQRFRRIIHCRFLQACFLFLPLFIRNKIAARMRRSSTIKNAEKADYMMDVNQQTICDFMTAYSADVLIHGHTHKPNYYQFEINGKPAERFVLGAWHDDCDYVVAAESIVLMTTS